MMFTAMPALRRAVRAPVLAVALLASASATHAQDTSPAAARTPADEVVKVTGAGDLFNPLIAGVIEQAKTPFLQQDPRLAKELDEIGDKLRAKLAPRLSELTRQVATLYAERFTDRELRAILAFYRSPVGKKLLTQQPQIIDASMKFAQNWANRLSDEVVEEMRAELKKRGHPM